ncbi:MAG: tRNA-dihydrouridine synthase family protein [Opitutales bacterium]|jgi:nifR3 family TIM-barrel protein
MPIFQDFFQEGSFPLFLAPMAGFTDIAFRDLCKRFGADVLVSEFVMANAVLEAGPQSRIWDMLSFSACQRPFGIQLFGSVPALMAEAAKRVADRLEPDFIDINCGCPAPKIVDQNAGCALLMDLPLAGRIAAAVVRAVPGLPVTAKIRTGWDAEHIVALEAARILEGEGIAALTVHGRTRAQGYGGDADWALIGEVARNLSIPVIGNGSVGGAYLPALVRDSGVSGLMIGRAALGRPWIFRDLKRELAGLPPTPPPEAREKLGTMMDYARALLGRGDDIRNIRAKLKPFTEGIAGARKLRAAMDGARTLAELEGLLARMPLQAVDSQPEADSGPV